MPNFVSGGAAASNAIEQFLMQREMQNRQAMLDDLMRQRQAADEEDRKRDLGLRERQFQAEQERLAAEDARKAEERAAAQRQQGNVAGVRGMMADAMTQGPLTPDSAKTIGIMAFREGMEAPDEVQQMLQPPKRQVVETTDAQGNPIRRAVTEDELASGVPIHREPRAPQGWQSAGSGVIFNPQTGEFRRAPGGADDAQPSQGAQFALDTADRVIEAIDSLMPPNAPDSRINNWTAGVGGNLLGRTGLSQDAVDVGAELETVAGNIAFNALQQMREASKTGGALGSIAQQELRLLQSVEGSLRQDQSPANLRAQLAKVRESMARYRAAQQAQGRAPGGRTGGAGPAGGPQGGTNRVGRFEIVGQ